MPTGCTVLVFAKAPVAGYAKMRLAGVLGTAGAARLAERLLVAAVGHAVDAGVGPVELCGAPDARHPAFDALAARFPIGVTGQHGGDLGERMARAFDRVLRGAAKSALLIGADAPRLDAAYLRRAAAALARGDVVIGPALDGGYVLIGLNQPEPALFEGVAWGTSQVLAQTRERIRRLGLVAVELEGLADVDRPDDLRHLPSDWPEASAAP